MGDTCGHRHGDFVDGYWLCGQCYEKMAEQPKWYSSKVVLGADYPQHQQVEHAAIKRAESGLTLSQFVERAARRLMVKCGNFTKSDAISYVIDLLKVDGTEFGSKDYDWSVEGGWELVREDMQYWDEESDGRND